MSVREVNPTAHILVGEAAPLLARLAAPSLARHLNITEQEAVTALQRGSLPMAADLDTASGARLLSLFKALGLKVYPAARMPALFALSFQLKGGDPALITSVLSSAFDRDVALIQKQLQAPGGVIFTDLTADAVDTLRRRFRRLPGLMMSMSDAATAVLDIFATRPVSAALRRNLSHHIALAALVPCRFSGALAAALRPAQADQVLARFESTGLIAVDRLFQRFDLYLTGIAGLDARDVADFLSIRADLSGAMVECVTPMSPVKIETGLARAAARQFQADYAAIGLQTCARLCGL